MSSAPIFADQTLFALIFVAVTAFISGAVRGYSGFGSALIFVPLASSVMDPLTAVPLLLVVDVVTAAPLFPNAWRQADRRAVGIMALGTLAGIPIGTWLLVHSDPITVRWMISGFVLALLLLLVSGWRYSGRPIAAVTVGVGTMSGFLSGLGGVGGPPVIAYWLGGTSPANIIRANFVLFIAVSTAIIAVNYIWADIFHAGVFLLALVVGPGYGLGIYLGARSFRSADERLFRKICYGLIAVAAIVSLPALDGLRTFLSNLIA